MRARDVRCHRLGRTALHGLRPVHLLLFLPWLALLGWMAASAWFLTDDAFISFRYARNLLEGHGLVFNPGRFTPACGCMAP